MCADGYTLFLTPTAAVMELLQPPAGTTNPPADGPGGNPNDPLAAAGSTADGSSLASVVSMEMVGANATPQIVGLDPLGSTSNYLIGNDSSQWLTNVANYGSVEYQDVWPGVNMVFQGSPNDLQYDFNVAAGANPNVIQLNFNGADQVTIDSNGNLLIQSGTAEVTAHAPVVYQTINGVQQPVTGQYVLLGGNQVGFSIGTYDTTQPLVIDPTLTYSTYLGGSNNEYGLGVAVDSSGSAYITGWTSSTNFPTTVGAYNTAGNGSDAFVTKLSANGQSVLYSTYLGGSGNNYGYGIAVDGSGDAYVSGATTAANFPTTAGAPDTSMGSSGEVAFVTKLNSTGTGLVYSTYVGGSNGNEDDATLFGYQMGNVIAVDGNGDAWITGMTTSNSFPTTSDAYQTTLAGGRNAFVTEINPAGTAFNYSTYLGGNNDDRGQGIALDPSGDAYVTGFTASSNFPTTAGVFQPDNAGSWDAFVSKIDPNLSGAASLVYSSYLGGTSDDYGTGIAVDSSGDAYLTGIVNTNGTGFPIVNAMQPTPGGGYDAYVTKVNPTGTALVYSTYYGGSATEYAQGIAVDSSGDAYVTGMTQSTNLPLANALESTNEAGGFDAFVLKLDPSGTAAYYSTYLGGTGDNRGQAIAVDNAGNAYVAGMTTSSNFPTTDSAQPAYGGGWDAFVVKLTDTVNHPPVIDNPTSIAVNIGQTLNLPGVTDPDGLNTDTISVSGLPSGATFNSTTGAITWTPSAAGSATITETATDDGGFNNDAVNSWPGNGNANDVAGGQNGTIVGNVTFTPGEVGDAFTFDGSNSYVQLPDNFFNYPTSNQPTASQTTPFTIDLSFKTTSGGVILGQEGATGPYGSPAGNVPAIYVGTDGLLRVEAFWSGSVNPITSSVPVNDGNYHYLAVTYDGAFETVYLDGKEIGTQALTQNSYANDYKYQLGTGYTNGWAGGNGGWYNFTGQIEEVNVYQRPLSPQEIYTAYLAGTNHQTLSQVTGLTAVLTTTIIVNATTPAVPAMPAPTDAGSALQFNGINDFVNVGTSPTLHSDRQLTIEGWFEVDSFTNQWQNILFKGQPSGNNNREYALWVNNTGFLYFTYGSTTTAYAIQTPTGSIQAGQWYHFAAVLDADTGTSELYLDGQLEASGSIDSSGILNSGGPLFFGHAVENWDNGLTGSLDDIRIYNVARSQSQIQSDMLTPLTGAALTNAEAAGLVGYWNFNEDGGDTVNDLTGNGNNGIFPGLLPTWIPNGTGSALLFGGLYDQNYVQVGNQPSLTMTGGTTLTMEASIYPTANIFGTIAGKDGEYLLSRDSNGVINWAVNSGNPGWTWYSTGYVAPLDTWTQVTLVVNTALNDGTIQLYANGVLVETYNGTAGNPMTPIGGWGGSFQIGARSVDNEFFTGAIDQVSVWNTARTAAQVAGDYTTPPVPADEPNLEGYWPLDEGTGTVAYDQTANGNNGTLSSTIQQGVPGPLTNDSDTAYSFNGGSIALSLPQLNTAVGADNSVSFWMNWNGADAVIPVGFQSYDLYIQGGYIGFNTGQGDLYGTSSAGLANGWHQIVAIFNNGNVTQCQLYIDGVQQTLSQVYGTPASRSVVSAAQISGWLNDQNYDFHGSLDEVAFFNRR